MSGMLRGAAILALPLFLAACFSAPRRAPFDYGPYVASDPRSVVVAPVAGGTPEQRDLLLSLIIRPLADRGYYVMPVRATQALAERHGFTAHARETTLWYDMNNDHGGSVVVDKPEDAEQIRKDAAELAAFFGADAVLFAQIVDWGHEARRGQAFKNMIDPAMTHAVGLDYILVDARGETLWRAQKHIVYRRGGGSLAAEIWNASMKADDADIDAGLAREANWWMITGERLRTPKLWYYSAAPMLVGPYHPAYAADRARRTAAGR